MCFLKQSGKGVSRVGDCAGPTLDWHLRPNEQHIVCGEKKLLLASPGDCGLACKVGHCPSGEKVSQLSGGTQRTGKEFSVAAERVLPRSQCPKTNRSPWLCWVTDCPSKASGPRAVSSQSYLQNLFLKGRTCFLQPVSTCSQNLIPP